MYCAIIGDLVSSRKIKDRAAAQVELKKCLDHVNLQYSKDIESEFIITLGDEFQGLLNTPLHLLSILDYIKMNFRHSDIRFGVGFGEMKTEINLVAIGADGPAYHVARSAIEKLKKDQNKKESALRDILIYGQNNKNCSLYSAVNTALSLSSVIESQWTEKQKQVIFEIESTEKTQREIANKLNITQSSVQRRISSSNYFSYRNAKNSIQNLIMDIWEVENEL